MWRISLNSLVKQNRSQALSSYPPPQNTHIHINTLVHISENQTDNEVISKNVQFRLAASDTISTRQPTRATAHRVLSQVCNSRPKKRWSDWRSYLNSSRLQTTKNKTQERRHARAHTAILGRDGQLRPCAVLLRKRSVRLLLIKLLFDLNTMYLGDQYTESGKTTPS